MDHRSPPTKTELLDLLAGRTKPPSIQPMPVAVEVGGETVVTLPWTWGVLMVSTETACCFAFATGGPDWTFVMKGPQGFETTVPTCPDHQQDFWDDWGRIVSGYGPDDPLTLERWHASMREARAEDWWQKLYGLVAPYPHDPLCSAIYSQIESWKGTAEALILSAP